MSILILGNPNSGKSLLFNKLTGLNHKVANFPGVTVEVRTGHALGLTMHDFPGIYSLQPLTKDEQVAVEYFRREAIRPATKAVLYVMDATRLERSLYLLLQLREEAKRLHRPLIVVMNIMDEVIAKGASVDVPGLSRALELDILPISAKKGMGMDELRARLTQLQATNFTDALPPDSTPIALDDVTAYRTIARQLARDYGYQTDLLLVSQNRLDSFFLSTFWGPIAFFGVMLFLFQSIFSWASPAMDFISDNVSAIGTLVASHIHQPVVADFVHDALFEGVGSFLVFAPQIFILFVIIGVLEDSGYLARAAIMLHRPLSWFGLSGRSFLPLLSGHACAIPAILATRTIESPRRRFLTILTIPFMSCSARIPVYTLLIAAFVPAVPVIGKLVTLQGLSFFMLYILGLFVGLLATGIISRLARNGRALGADAPFVVELPPYRVPATKPIFKHALNRTLDFVRKAGGIIFTVTLVIWVLGYFPNGAGHLDDSYLGRMGHAIEGVFRPMGMDWKIGVAVLTSFLAREVFVGTLGTLYGIADAKENIHSLSDTLAHSGMTAATAIALMVFFALSMQCVSTLAVIKKETGHRMAPVYVFLGMTILAYLSSTLAYHLFS